MASGSLVRDCRPTFCKNWNIHGFCYLCCSYCCCCSDYYSYILDFHVYCSILFFLLILFFLSWPSLGLWLWIMLLVRGWYHSLVATQTTKTLLVELFCAYVARIKIRWVLFRNHCQQAWSYNQIGHNFPKSSNNQNFSKDHWCILFLGVDCSHNSPHRWNFVRDYGSHRSSRVWLCGRPKRKDKESNLFVADEGVLFWIRNNHDPTKLKEWE